MKRALAVAAVFFALAPVLAAEKAPQVTAEARVLKDKIKIGDDLKLIILVEHPRKYEVTPPSGKLDVSPFEIKRVEPVPTRKGQNRVQQTFRLTLTAFQTGSLEIPPVPVEYRDEEGVLGAAQTSAVPVTVLSVGSKLTDAGDIRAIKQPVSIPFVRFWSWVFGLSAAGLFVFLIVNVVLRKLKERESAESRKPPHVRARIELERLKDHGYLEEKDYRSYYSELSDILRRYLERRYGVEALERTTVELLRELERRAFDAQVQSGVREILSEADLIKFAKLAPEHATAGRLEGLLLETVEKTKPSPAERKKG